MLQKEDVLKSSIVKLKNYVDENKEKDQEIRILKHVLE